MIFRNYFNMVFLVFAQCCFLILLSHHESVHNISDILGLYCTFFSSTVLDYLQKIQFYQNFII